MSINYDLIREVKAWAKEFVREKIAAGLVKYGAYSRSTASGEHDKIAGYETEGADEQSYDFEGRRVFPFGIRSLPPKGTWGVWIGKGGESGDGVIVGAESSRFGPSNLNDGEVALYNKVSGVSILLDQNGAIIITDKGGATVKLDGSGNVSINPAAAKALKLGDQATPVTGAVQLGPVGNLAVLVQGTVDGVFGVPVVQAVAASATIVKAG